MSDLNPDDVAALRAAREAAAVSEAEERDIAQQIRDGIAAIERAREHALSDIGTVDALSAQAASLSAAITNRLAQVEAFTPGATYRPADLVAVKGEIVWALKQLKLLTDAQAGQYAWRRAVDQNAVLTDGALLGLAWLARTQRGGND